MNEISLQHALSARRSCRAFEERTVPVEIVHRLLQTAQGKTDNDGKRTAPSAHALFPLRLVVTAGRISGTKAGTYSVNSDATELTLIQNRDIRSELETAALEDQPWIGQAAGIVTIAADFAAVAHAFAEQPPYGARGTRYVYIEAGAAAQNLQLQAVGEGLGCVLVAGFRDEKTAEILGLNAPISPVLHLCFGWPSTD